MTLQQIYDTIDDLCDSDSTSYPVDKKILHIDAGYEEIMAAMIAEDGNRETDDTRYSKEPIGYLDLVNGQKQYTISDAFLSINRVSVKDANGHWLTLNKTTKEEIGCDPEEYQTTPGVPSEYLQKGKAIYLFPAPATGSVTMTGGLKLDFDRTAYVLAAGDVSVSPGFYAPYHSFLAYRGSIPYCSKYHQDRVVLYEKRADALKKECLKFAAVANQTEAPAFEVELRRDHV